MGRKLEEERLAREEMNRAQEEKLMQAEELHERKRLKEEKRIRLAAIAEAKRLKELTKQRKKASVGYVSTSLIPDSMTHALEKIGESKERASMELEELQQKKVETLIAAELLRQRLQRIREETILCTSKEVAGETVLSAFTSTVHNITAQREAAALL